MLETDHKSSKLITSHDREISSLNGFRIRKILNLLFLFIQIAVDPRKSVFISYCWHNSREAVKKGHREVEGAVGAVDPRRIKQSLELKKKISCWLDIEQTGKEVAHKIVF